MHDLNLSFKNLLTHKLIWTPLAAETISKIYLLVRQKPLSKFPKKIVKNNSHWSTGRSYKYSRTASWKRVYTHLWKVCKSVWIFTMSLSIHCGSSSSITNQPDIERGKLLCRTIFQALVECRKGALQNLSSTCRWLTNLHNLLIIMAKKNSCWVD